jgi:hypothetical protein
MGLLERVLEVQERLKQGQPGPDFLPEVRRESPGGLKKKK